MTTPPERPTARGDLAAVFLLLIGIVVAWAVVTTDPTPTPGKVGMLGPVGDRLARELHDALGVSVYVLLASWFVAVALLALRRDRGRRALRWFAWLALVPCAAAVADLAGPIGWEHPPTGPGGTIGAWINVRLRQQFPATAGWIVAAVTSITALFAFDRLTIGMVRLLLRRRKSVSGAGEVTSSATKPDAAVSRKTEVPAPAPSQGGEASAVPIRRASAAAITAERIDFELPPLTLLEDSDPTPVGDQDSVLREKALLLEKTFSDFGLSVRVVGIYTGPVITLYEVSLDTGLRVHKVTNLADDLALSLRVPSVRIVAPLPGKNTVGIEVPNEKRAVVRLKELLNAGSGKIVKLKLPLFLGKDTEGRPLIYDLAEMPHLLIAGRTGTGKSVCLNAIILSLLMTRRPDQVKFLMIDPKMLELSEYGKIPHLMHPVVKDMKKAEAILSWAVDKMEERYDVLSRARVRGIAGYNELSPEEVHRRVQPADDEERRRLIHPMPYIVIVIDEMNDLMMLLKKEVEGHIIRLAQKSRAAGIHLIVATQKPTVDVITGLIKSNLPARICFQVSSRVDSRVVLDEMGAEKLLGKGDMLFLQPGTATITRAQGSYASDHELQRVTGYLECEPEFAEELAMIGTGDAGGDLKDRLRSRDELYEQAIEIIIREGRGSTSLLQRALGVGYGRAARMIDFMAEDGILGRHNGSQAREVIMSFEQWAEIRGRPRVGV